MKSIKKIGVLTSGGDAPGLNAAIRSIVLAASPHQIEVCGFQNGFDGLIHNNFVKLKFETVNSIINLGGTILDSTRNEDFKIPKFRELALQNLLENEYDGLIVMGGNGTAQACKIFYKESDFPVLLIPKTIDHDIPLASNCIGFDTATNTAMEAIDKIRDTANSHHRLFFIEVMGRNCGHLAITAGVSGGADIIIIPEKKIPKNTLVQLLNKSSQHRKDSLIVVVAEGALDNTLEDLVEEIKPEITQFDIRISKLGHIQRGGSPSAYDRYLSSRLGFESIKALVSGHKGEMLDLKLDQLSFIPLESLMEKQRLIPQELIDFVEISNFSN